MRCETVQFKIEKFLHGTLGERESADFVCHIRECKACREELEVYYVINKAVEQLSNDTDIGNGYIEELERDMARADIYNKKRKRRYVFTYVILLILLTIGISILLLELQGI